MRTIKFRAWDKLGNDKEIPCIRSWDLLMKDRYAHTADSIFNDPMLILMQFTGLHDKNGVEIYEGDVLSHGKTGRIVVEWDNPDGKWMASGIAEYKDFVNLDPLWRWAKVSEVIGNIYEHPSLLTPTSAPGTVSHR